MIEFKKFNNLFQFKIFVFFTIIYLWAYDLWPKDCLFEVPCHQIFPPMLMTRHHECYTVRFDFQISPITYRALKITWHPTFWLCQFCQITEVFWKQCCMLLFVIRNGNFTHVPFPANVKNSPTEPLNFRLIF